MYTNLLLIDILTDFVLEMVCSGIHYVMSLKSYILMNYKNWKVKSCCFYTFYRLVVIENISFIQFKILWQTSMNNRAMFQTCDPTVAVS